MILSLGLALLGAALAGAPAHWFRIDLVRCASWPPLELAVWCGGAYAAGIACLTMAWVRIGLSSNRPAPSLRWVVIAGALVHVVAALGLPYLSQDPLYYAALGRSMATFGGDPTQPLSRVLPAGDAFLLALPEGWRAGTSPYGPAFHLVARAVAAVGGDDLALQLRAYQLVGLACMVAVALIVAAAARDRGETAGSPARAAASVLFCPLAIIEGTQNGHNDVMLAVATAAFVWALGRRRPATGMACLLAGVTVKLSALLWFGVHLGQRLVDGWRRLSPSRRAVLVAGCAAVGAATVAWLCVRRSEWLSVGTSSLIDNPHGSALTCTRALECLPRALARWWFDAPGVSSAIGIAFRVLAGIWLVGMAVRSASPARRWLGGLATAVFIYYLCLHPWAQSWYLLPLLPFLPFMEAARRAPILVFCVTSTLYYAVFLPFGCVTGELGIGTVEIVETFITIVPPIWILIRRRGVHAVA